MMRTRNTPPKNKGVEHRPGHEYAGPPTRWKNPKTLFDSSKASDDSQDVGPDPAVSDTLARLGERLEDLTSQIKRFDADLSALLTEVRQLNIEKRVLTEMHDRCRDLSEQFHERECLNPLFRSVIGITDRCRQETARLRRLHGYVQEIHPEGAPAVRHVLEARNADLVEIEALLAHFGVEAFQHPSDRFDPSQQTCLKRVQTQKAELHERLAGRVLPGYRRGSKLVRPECVTVYVASEPKQKEV